MEEKPLEEKALDLLEEAYKRSKYQEVGGRRLLLTFLDGDVALSVGLNPTPRETPEGYAYRHAVSFLEESGAVEIPDLRGQELAGTTYYEITPRGIDMLRESDRIT